MKRLSVCLVAMLLSVAGNVRAQAAPIPAAPGILHEFEEPLESLGSPSSQEEAEALRATLDAYARSGFSDAIEPLEAFLKAHPESPWRASLHMNLGLALRRTGWPGKAMAHFEAAWQQAKAEPGSVGRRIADRAVTEWMWLCMKAGDDTTLERILGEAKERPMRGGSAQRRADAERALFAMQKEAKFYLCGPTALATVNRVMKPGRPVDPRDVKDTIPGPKGTSLFQLAMMASHWDIPLQMAKRDPGTKVLTPSVMHWKVGHWAAVLQEADGRYLVQEDVLEEAIWVRREALDAETTGHCLVPYVPLPEGFTRVSAEEGKSVWGRGRVGIGPWYGPYGDSVLRPQMHPAPSVAQAGVRMGNLSLEVWFAPLSLPRHDGPAWPFELRYQQRITWQPDRPAFSQAGPGWTFSGISYLLEDDRFQRQDVQLFTETGTWLRFTGFDPATGRYARNIHTRDLLVRLRSGHYELHRPDGTVETFAHGVPGGPSARRVFRTEQRVPHGPILRYEFDGANRLKRMMDDAGKGFSLHYEDPRDAWRLSRVADGHGREAQFSFNGDGQLVQIIDAAGGKTSFHYLEKDREPDVLRGLTTPEGSWRFDHGQKDLNRWVEWVDAAGKRHRAEFRHDAPGLSSADADAPPGPLNQYMQDRSTYYWGSEALARHRGNYKQAEAIRYLFNPTQLALSWTLEAVKNAEDPRIWLLYPDQVNTQVEGLHPMPRWISQRTRKGDQQWDLGWDDWGRLTELQGGKGWRVLWTYPEGPGLQPRSVSWERGESQIRWESDEAGRLMRLRKGKDTLWAAERDHHGNILGITDARGRVWRLSYDQAARWTGIKGPASYQWTFDALGRVATLQEGRGRPIPIVYDGLDRVLGSTRPVAGHPVPVRPISVRADRAGKKVPSQEGAQRDRLLAWARLPQSPFLLPIPSSIRPWMNVPRGVTDDLGSGGSGTEGPPSQLKLRLERWARTLGALEPGSVLVPAARVPHPSDPTYPL